MNIERQKIFGQESAGAIDITFGVDAPFVPIMGVCMTSILKNNPARKFRFHVFIDAINPPDEQKISELGTTIENIRRELIAVKQTIDRLRKSFS